jgi:hypothetical protein
MRWFAVLLVYDVIAEDLPDGGLPTLQEHAATWSLYTNPERNQPEFQAIPPASALKFPVPAFADHFLRVST